AAKRPTWPPKNASLSSDYLLRNLKYLPQVRKVLRVITHTFSGGVRQLGHRLIVAARHLDHHLQGFIAQVIGQIGTDTKSQLTATMKAQIQRNGARDGQGITKNQRLV